MRVFLFDFIRLTLQHETKSLSSPREKNLQDALTFSTQPRPRHWLASGLDLACNLHCVHTKLAHFENGEKCDGSKIWSSAHTIPAKCRFQNVPVRVPLSKSTVFKMGRRRMYRHRVNGRPIRHIFTVFKMCHHRVNAVLFTAWLHLYRPSTLTKMANIPVPNLRQIYKSAVLKCVGSAATPIST